MNMLTQKISFSGSLWQLAYEEVPVIDPDMGLTNQDGYILNLLRDGVVVYGTRFIKGQAIGAGTVDSQADIFVKGVNMWLSTHSVTAPPQALSEWKTACLVMFARFSFLVENNILKIAKT